MKRVVLLFAVAVMMAVMLLSTAGLVMAAPGNNGKGAANANANAASGITTATNKSCPDLC